MVETFFKTLKAELVWRAVLQNRAQATDAIGRYIDVPPIFHPAGTRVLL